MLSAVNNFDQVKLDKSSLGTFYSFTSFPPTLAVQIGKYFSTTYLMIKITLPV